jgi:hypothetical protein
MLDFRISAQSWLKGFRMLFLLETAVLVASIIYLCSRQRYPRQRNLQSWEELIDGVIPAFDNTLANDPAAWVTEMAKHTEKLWQTSRDLRGFRVMFRNARVLMEMIDHADLRALNTSTPIDVNLLDSLRRDAMQIRGTSFVGMARYALSW